MSKRMYTDYTKYVFTIKDWAVYAVMLAAIASMFGRILFENLFIGIVFSSVSSPFVYIRYRRYLNQKRIVKLERQFCDILQLTAASLAAGQSLTGCINEIATGVLGAAGDYLLIRKEFIHMQRLISLNISPEEAIDAFAGRSGSKDIINFSEAVYAASQAGGNMIQIVRNASSTLRVKYDAEDEIRRILNLPRFNHRIMMLMPFAMTTMMKLIAPGYIEPLYAREGRVIMFFVSVMILLSWFIGEKISDIKF